MVLRQALQAHAASPLHCPACGERFITSDGNYSDGKVLGIGWLSHYTCSRGHLWVHNERDPDNEETMETPETSTPETPADPSQPPTPTAPPPESTPETDDGGDGSEGDDE